MYNELTNGIDDLQYFFSRVKHKEPEHPPFRSGKYCSNWDKKQSVSKV
jgi:hypothetical protein